ILGEMEDGAVFVNTARGAVVDTDALIAELKSGRIYASLDVYDTEPLEEDSELRGMRNCQLTCHSAGPTLDRMIDFGEATIDNIERYTKGEDLERIVDAQKYDLIT
ncbi:MAG TPA: NAD(P)-dependent oxidoreductase, partial [Dehalococcoidia bacterium]|nr:NAD(P)-dependent oxidoreductase [Dehalococcoidia bacterium]